MNLTLIVNPHASSVKPKRIAAAQEALADGHDLTVAETLYRNHATDLAREAAAAGAQVVVVLGGDGTVNEAANGLVGTDTALAVLPGGSTNVFGRTIGGARKLKPALPQMKEALSRPPQRVGLGLVNGRYFLFHVGLGFDAAVVAKVEDKPHLKRKIGQGIFVYAAFATWFRGYDRTHPHLVVKQGGETVVDDGYFAICANTHPYTYLGVRPLTIAPDDAGFDKNLVLVTLRTIRVFKFLSLVGSTLGGGKKLRNHPEVDYRPNLTEVTVEAWMPPGADHASFPYQADGDYLGEAEQLTITYEPDRLLLITPTV
ncbi:MAG: diacylglycerol/lipid kinase family protein [Acidimicrobiales bacterium]